MLAILNDVFPLYKLAKSEFIDSASVLFLTPNDLKHSFTDNLFLYYLFPNIKDLIQQDLLKL